MSDGCRLDGRDLSILGLGASAQWNEVQAAYRRLAMQLHPDRVREQDGERARESEIAFRSVNEAYERLRLRRAEARLKSQEHIERISHDPAAAALEVEELELRIRHSSSPQVRAAAALLLGRHEGPRSAAALRAACADPEPQVRKAAIEAMKERGSAWELLRARAADLLRTTRRED